MPDRILKQFEQDSIATRELTNKALSADVDFDKRSQYMAYSVLVIILFGAFFLAYIGKDIAAVITDIEMPQMDGHHLTKKIKDDSRFDGMPVIIFSSLVNDDMKRKGEALGANAQLSKPEIGNLVRIVDKLVDEFHLDK